MIRTNSAIIPAYPLDVKHPFCVECGASRADCPAKSHSRRCLECSAAHKKQRVAAANRAYKEAHGGYTKDLTCLDCGVPRPGASLAGPRGRCAACRSRVRATYQAELQTRPLVRARRNGQARDRTRRLTPEQKEARRQKHLDYMRGHFEAQMLYAAKERAKRSGLAFNLDMSDIIVPERCPIFSMPLERSGGLANVNLATLDRIEPALGYVKGNVWVISWRANKLKSDASLDELRTLLAAIESKVA